jgi:hypothetical protein
VEVAREWDRTTLRGCSGGLDDIYVQKKDGSLHVVLLRPAGRAALPPVHEPAVGGPPPAARSGTRPRPRTARSISSSGTSASPPSLSINPGVPGMAKS